MSDAPKAITRYDPDWDKDMTEAEGGDWVRFEDHEDVVRELRQALEDCMDTIDAERDGVDCESLLNARAVLAKLTPPTPPIGETE